MYKHGRGGGVSFQVAVKILKLFFYSVKKIKCFEKTMYVSYTNLKTVV